MSAAERLVDAIRRRDFGALAACFAEDATMRVLTPKQLRQLEGREEIAGHFRGWFADMDEFEVVDSDVKPIADRVRIRWHTRGRDPEKGLQENDHTGYATLENGLIAALNVSCAGFRPAA